MHSLALPDLGAAKRATHRLHNLLAPLTLHPDGAMLGRGKGALLTPT